MSRAKGFFIAAAILIGAGALAVLLVSLAPAPEQREPPSPVPYVETVPAIAGAGAIPVFGAGTVRPSAEVHIAPQVGGRVVWVHPAFLSGRRVAAGETLFRVEEEDYVYRLRDAEATLAARQADFLKVQEQAAIARAEYERYSEREQAKAAAGPLALYEPQLKAAQAGLDRDEARVASAALALSRTRVQAPFDGFVREESVDIGQVVAPGVSVGRLFATAAVEVVVPLADADAALIPNLWAGGEPDIAGGASARVLADYGEHRFAWRGRVDRAEASLDEATRTIDVIIRVPTPFTPGTPTGPNRSADDGPPLLVGKFVEVEIEGWAPRAYFRLRRAALQPGNEVWAVADDGTVQVKPVQILQRNNDEVYVTGALDDGQGIIVSGIQFATDGMEVQTGTAPDR